MKRFIEVVKEYRNYFIGVFVAGLLLGAFVLNPIMTKVSG